MKKYFTKSNIKLLINLLALLIICLFYILSPLLNNVFSKNIILIITITVIILFSGQIILFLLKKDKLTKIVSEINDYVQIFLLAIILVEFIFSFILFPATVSQNSMNPTLYPEDRLIIKCTNDIDYYDIIVFEYDKTIQKESVGIANKELLIKRVIAGEGQSFEYINNTLYINGQIVEDKFAISEHDGLNLYEISQLNGMLEQCLQEDGTYIIPQGWYFVMGDNRYASTDSRTFGLVHESQIYGKVIYKVNSLFNWEKIN